MLAADGQTVEGEGSSRDRARSGIRTGAFRILISIVRREILYYYERRESTDWLVR